MGNSNQSRMLVDSSYQFIYNKQTQNYGEAKIYRKRNSNDLVAVVSRSMGQSQRVQEAVNQSRAIIHKHLVSVYGCATHEADDLCSRMSIIQILMEYLPNTLTEEIKYRKDKGQMYLVSIYRFTEAEIWYVIIGLADVLHFLQINGQDIVDLHPNRVLLNERKEFKIVKSYLVFKLGKTLVHDGLPGFMQVKMGLRPFEYLSPEQLENMNSQRLQNLDQEPINVFNIGLIAFQMATLASAQELYQDREISFDFLMAQDKIDKGFNKCKYTKQLYNSILQMLEPTTNYRLTYQSILGLKIHREQIALSLWPEMSPRVTMPLQESMRNSMINDQQQNQYHYDSPQMQIYGNENFEPISAKDQSQSQSFVEDEALNDRVMRAIMNSRQALESYGGVENTINEPQFQSQQNVDIFPVTSNFTNTPKASQSLNQSLYDDNRIMDILKKADEEIRKSMEQSRFSEY